MTAQEVVRAYYAWAEREAARQQIVAEADALESIGVSGMCAMTDNRPRPACIFCRHMAEIVRVAPLTVACTGFPPDTAREGIHELGWLVRAPATCGGFIPRVQVRAVWRPNESGRMVPVGYIEEVIR